MVCCTLAIYIYPLDAVARTPGGQEMTIEQLAAWVRDEIEQERASYGRMLAIGSSSAAISSRARIDTLETVLAQINPNGIQP